MAKILVIDDYAPMRDILEVLLPAGGHEVSTAMDGTAGLRLAGSMPFDLALVDVDLPDFDGIVVCQALKENAATRHMHVVLMTGRPGRDVDVRSRLAGALMVLAKPFLGATLLAEIGRLTGGTAACQG